MTGRERVGSLRRRLIALLAISLPSVPLASTLPLGGQELAWSGSLQYASGSYIFSEPTRTWVLSSRVAAESGALRIAVGLPLILQNSGAVTTVGGGMLPTGGPDYMALRGRAAGEVVPMRKGGGRQGMVSAAVTGDSVAGPAAYELQVGDPLLDAEVDVYRGTGALRSLSIGAMTKVPVADLESGVGTGRWDAAAAASAAFGAGAATVFADVEYWLYGDLPEPELRDGPAYGLGLGLALSARLSAMLSLDGASPIVEGVAAPLSLSAALGYSVAPGRSLTLGLGAGLSEASPDAVAFLGWRIGSGR